MEEDVSLCGKPFLAAGIGEILQCEKNIFCFEVQENIAEWLASQK